MNFPISFGPAKPLLPSGPWVCKAPSLSAQADAERQHYFGLANELDYLNDIGIRSYGWKVSIDPNDGYGTLRPYGGPLMVSDAIEVKALLSELKRLKMRRTGFLANWSENKNVYELVKNLVGAIDERYRAFNKTPLDGWGKMSYFQKMGWFDQQDGDAVKCKVQRAKEAIQAETERLQGLGW
ncbi:MAG: hypothetical protein ACK5PW_18600 [Burkholderiales bacterium]|jgi:hypothetical protein